LAYEQGLERRDVAIRGLYRMYHGRLHGDLMRFGISPEEAAAAFENQPFPRTERDVFAAIRRCQKVAEVAEKLLAHYILLEWEDRKHWYEGDRREAVLRASAE
jgi:hypothetical protein